MTCTCDYSRMSVSTWDIFYWLLEEWHMLGFVYTIQAIISEPEFAPLTLTKGEQPLVLWRKKKKRNEKGITQKWNTNSKPVN